jgi:hypothetical protein
MICHSQLPGDHLPSSFVRQPGPLTQTHAALAFCPTETLTRKPCLSSEDTENLLGSCTSLPKNKPHSYRSVRTRVRLGLALSPIRPLFIFKDTEVLQDLGYKKLERGPNRFLCTHKVLMTRSFLPVWCSPSGFFALLEHTRSSTLHLSTCCTFYLAHPLPGSGLLIASLC